MIPLKLQLKNFLSYGNELQTIDFGNYSLICLSGKNGHGKSALLDALTWSLWGQARKIGGSPKADQGLLRLGQTQMMVSLDFECAGNSYRIRREYMQTYGKPVTVLDFALYDAKANTYISLTEKTIRDTQAKIENTLRLSFDSFINSAFLRQGHSNEFSKKSPKERKEILAAILGLESYERIRRRATEKIKSIHTQQHYFNTLKEKFENDLAQKNAINESLKAIIKAQADNLQKKSLLSQEKVLYEQTLENINQEKNKLTIQKAHYQQLQENKHLLEKELHEKRAAWKRTHSLQLKSINYNQLEQDKEYLLNEIKNHQELLQNRLLLQQELLTEKEKASTLYHSLHAQKNIAVNNKKITLERLLSEKKHLVFQINDATHLLEKVNSERDNLQKEQEEIEKKIIILDTQKNKYLEAQFQKRRDYYQRWIAQLNFTSSELQALSQKCRLVNQEQSPCCPLCEQNLSASRKRFLKQKFDEQTKIFERNYYRFNIIIKKLKQLLITQHEQLQLLGTQTQEQAVYVVTKDELLKKITICTEKKLDVQQNLNKYKELLAIVEQTIQSEQNFLNTLTTSNHPDESAETKLYTVLQTNIVALEQQIGTHKYNKQKHDTALQQLVYTQKQLDEYKNVNEHQHIQPQRMLDIQELCRSLKTLKKKLSESSELNKQEFKLLESQKSVKEKIKELETIHADRIKEYEQLLQQRGSLENQQKKLEETEKDYYHYQKEIQICIAQAADYHAIAHVTSKDGIQALLIEEAIPEIEHEANELLSRLTDNQTQLFIESLRDLKKGGSKETLDIKISDATGIRPYELFSGGEAFRIDFALRIAISKLLARRAGTSLQTLIIDEGFGSQDEEGLSHIMEALYKIQNDFAKIIIVSHLNSMKNQFPVHFVIEKRSNGSTVEIFEH